MKKLLSLLMCGLLLFGCGDKYDDSALRNDLNDLENRVAKLEELCKQMNTNISSLQKIVEALQDNLSISKVEQISDGYIIHFSDGSTATIKNGKNSEDAPIIGVKKDTDGIYYWTLDGEWLTDEKGNKVKAQGTDGKDGVDGEDGTNGKDGITPQLKIENGRWMLSMDNGKTWTDIGQATGADGTDGEDGVDGKDGTNGIFKSVTEDNDNVYFTLEDDSVITIPKSDNSKFAIAFDTTDIAILNGGESKTISYTITDATKNTVVKAIAQDGWKVKVDATSTDKGTITITAPNPIVESEILVFANDGSYRTVMVSLNCMQGQINIADNSINATSAGGTQEIKLTTNLDYTIEIPEDAQSWLSLAPETRALREDTIVFEVTANEGMQRYTTVALKDEQGKILQTIIFRQLGTCTEVHVETKGELENELAGYDYANIESLKITGVLNDVDFLFIYRMMPNLKNLDIAEVNITALPIQAFYKSTNVENLILPNTLITIGEEMFYQSKLKTVVIPANATTIGNSAFEQCASLISIDIPANVETIGTAVFWGCSSLATVTFENGSQLKTIGGGSSYYGAFSDCTALTSIEIPASVETIEAAAFCFESVGTGGITATSIRNQIKSAMEEYPAVCGVKAESELDGQTAKIRATVRFQQAGNYKIACVLTENDIQKTNNETLPVFNHVLRTALTDMQGVAIEPAVAEAGERSFDFEVTLNNGWDSRNCEFVIYVFKEEEDAAFIVNNGAVCPVGGKVDYKYESVE